MIGAAYCGRKDLAMSKQRRFPVEFKCRVVEEHLSGMTGPAQLFRRHNISSEAIIWVYEKPINPNRPF